MRKIFQMRQLLKLFPGMALLLSAVSAFGQGSIEVMPPVSSVRLVVGGAEKPIELRALDIRSEIAGASAQTTVEMEFYNPNGRVLEGELQFPLLAGQTVTGFALEMENSKGKRFMRDAVPVEKARGRQTFEDITRRNVDPALLEVTAGNNFKLRVYPLNPRQTRRVRVIYREQLRTSADRSRAFYRLPLDYADRVANLSFDIRAVGAAAKPTVIDSASVELSFREGKRVFTAEAEQQNVRLAGRVLNISIPLPGGETVWRGDHDGKTYFYTEIPAMVAMEQKRVSAQSLALLWDASGSRAKVNHAVEMEFLDAFFRQADNIEVSFQTIRNVVEPPVTFTVKNGDWSDLRKTLESVVYDGATNLAAAVPPSADLAFLFSDGLDNYSTVPLPQPRMPLFAFIAVPGADTTRLKGLAARSGGALIDLRLMGVRAALESIGNVPVRVLSVAGNGVSGLVWNPPTTANPTLTVAGVVEDATLPLRVSFAGADGNPVEHIIAGFRDAPESDLIPSTWAAMKVEQLEEEYGLRRGEIRRIGKAFRIATRETSLIVLDNVSDYVHYNIDPPAELKEEYDRQLAQIRVTRNKAGKLDRVAAEWKARETWWKKDFPKDDRPKDAKKSTGGDYSIQAMTMTGSGAFEESTADRSATQFVAPTALPSEIPAPSDTFAGVSSENLRNLSRNGIVAQDAADTEVSIALRPWTPDAPYIRRIKEASNEDVYRIYLDERPDYENSVAFYLDIAYQLQERGLKDLALRVLSNLAEMDLENRQILRVLGYRLLEAGMPTQAVVIFEKVLALGEEEPQSYRDLGQIGRAHV